MGTSGPYGGHKDRNPLLPRDYIDRDGLFPSHEGDESSPPDESDEQKESHEDQNTPKDKDEKINKSDKTRNPLKRETPWRDAKTSFSRHINGTGNNNIGKTMQAYGRAAGSTKGLIFSSKGGILAGNALAQFLSNNFQGSDNLSKRIRDIFSSGNDTKTTLSLLADALSPSPDDKESSVARDAITNTICYLYEYIDTNKLDISILQNMDIDLQNHTLSIYITEYIWGKMLNDLQSRIEEKILSQNRIIEIETEYRDYIKNKVDVEIRKNLVNVQNLHLINIPQIYENCCEVLFK
jgi:hypothetical protein